MTSWLGEMNDQLRVNMTGSFDRRKVSYGPKKSMFVNVFTVGTSGNGDLEGKIGGAPE